MAGRMSAATERAIRMVQKGVTPLQAAQRQKIAPSTIYNAMKRLGIKPADKTAICRTDGRCQYAIDHGAEGLGHCPVGRCAMPRQEGKAGE